MKRFILAGIGFYRKWVSPVFPGACRFYPTCSAYADEAVDRYGVLKGSLMATARILKCHPWHPGGYDPVSPDRGDIRFQSPNPGQVNFVSTGSVFREEEPDVKNLPRLEGN